MTPKDWHTPSASNSWQNVFGTSALVEFELDFTILSLPLDAGSLLPNHTRKVCPQLTPRGKLPSDVVTTGNLVSLSEQAARGLRHDGGFPRGNLVDSAFRVHREYWWELSQSTQCPSSSFEVYKTGGVFTCARCHCSLIRHRNWHGLREGPMEAVVQQLLHRHGDFQLYGIGLLITMCGTNLDHGGVHRKLHGLLERGNFAEAVLALFLKPDLGSKIHGILFSRLSGVLRTRQARPQ